MIVTVLLISLLVVLYLTHVYRSYSFFRDMGIDGPRPSFFWGNLGDFARTKRISLSIKQWTEQFGRIYGYFEGHTPVLVISDPEILDQIFQKNFSKFHSRRQFPLEDRSTHNGVHLFSATGDHWRRQRSIINPTFSPLKIKRMLPMIDHCISKFITQVEERSEFDIYQSYKSLTMDLIWRCCFGIETDMQGNPNHPYLLRSQQVFARENSAHLMTILGIVIPELQPCWLSMHMWMNSVKVRLRRLFPRIERFIADDPNEWLKENVEELIEEAPKTSSEQTDLLHLMLEASQKKCLLTVNEVKQNMYLFMVAGYETASTALAYVTYILSTHPREQKKLQDHIDFHFPSDDTPLDSDLLNKMDYLDWVIRETLRMYPLTPIIINRQCSETIHLPGLGSILPGTKLTLDMYSLHYDLDLWGPVDTKQFYPERFATKRHPLAWVAFGAGPRQCVGMRFALAEIKIAVIRLLQTYTIHRGSAEQDLDLVELVTISPKQVPIRLERRASR